ncbi:ATP-dependent DNA helicase PIF1 [Colletotrichum nymphaeae SA-01]|uniref:ATP-dependent DNA helicase n=1 Tax=Colletotrichum nymphaeae SA-01 TaxID=1460502 RepID=A0A135TI90_9PEZI|nr:ATP-dependent DNA helicase PIF1 [Colletotrichum nymphaeae SA-01]
MGKPKPARDQLVGNPRPASKQALQAAKNYINDSRNPVVLKRGPAPKYYVVYYLRGPGAHGRKYGIFTDWNETKKQTEGCQNKNTTASSFNVAMNLLISGLALEIDAGALLNYSPAHQSRSIAPGPPPAPAPVPAVAPSPVKRRREEQDERDQEPLIGFYFDVHRPKAVKREASHRCGSRESPIKIEDDDDVVIKEEKDDAREAVIKKEDDDSTQAAIKREDDSHQAAIKSEGNDFCEAAVKWEGDFDDEEEAMRDSQGFFPLTGYSDQTNEYIKRENDRSSGEKGPAIAEAAPEFPLCPEQQHALDLAMQGHSLFITGSGGCGKSVLVKALNQAFEAQNKTVYLVAPTGQAATNINGRTTFSYAGWDTNAPRETLRTLIQGARRTSVYARIESTDVLIIDEISMVESEFFNRLSDVIGMLRREAFARGDDKICRKQTADSVRRPFGGIQVIAVGDFCQLPPVQPFQYCTEEVEYDEPDKLSTPCHRYVKEQTMVLDKERKLHFCPLDQAHPTFPDAQKWAFNSRAWAECNFEYIHLTKIHRQTDEKFITMLQNIRLGHTTDSDLNVLLQHREVRNGIALFSKRQEAQAYNNGELKKLPSKEELFNALDHPEDLGEDKKNRFNKQLSLKAGMPVVLLANLDVENGLCNGSQGKLVRFVRKLDECDKPKMPDRENYKEDNYAFEVACARYKQMSHYINGPLGAKGFPEIIFATGKSRVILPYCNMHNIETEIIRTVNGSKKVLKAYSARAQIPLVPGWAMTIHKSQSLSLDRVSVNLQNVWDGRQTYVALSRARSLGGLKVIGNKSKMRRTLPLDPEVSRFMKEVERRAAAAPATASTAAAAAADQAND